MSKRQWLGLLPAFLLCAAGIILLMLVSDADNIPQILQNIGIILLIPILAIGILSTLFFLMRELLHRVWQSGLDEMRLKTLGEHHRFLSRLDHELKNPLTALRAGLASLSLILRDDEQRQIVQTLVNETQRLSRLVTDLRKLAELDATTLDFQTIQVDDLGRHIKALIDERSAVIGRTVRLNCTPKFERKPMIVGDTDLLLLAVHNLLDNAVKYARDDDLVIVSIECTAKDVQISVTDSGMGIDEAEQALVWEELYRGSSAVNFPGSGIGLALVRTIVERHGGWAKLESKVGHGTTVSIHLPLL